MSRSRPARVLILGGTGEARELAAALADLGVSSLTSLAGRTSAPAALAGERRIGGFGGVDGLIACMRGHATSHLVDATHPFASRIGHQAEVACGRLDVARVRLLRPSWPWAAGDRWHEVESASEAAALLPGLGRRVLLTTGQKGLNAFAAVPGLRLLVRSIERPPSLPDGAIWLGARGPFRLEDEVGLMRGERIEVLVSKQSGGAATYPKIEAARELGLPVILLRRPAPPPGPVVATVGEALDWIGQSNDGRAGRST